MSERKLKTAWRGSRTVKYLGRESQHEDEDEGEGEGKGESEVSVVISS